MLCMDQIFVRINDSVDSEVSTEKKLNELLTMKFGWDPGRSIFSQQRMAIVDWQHSSLQGFLVPERSSIPMHMGHPEQLPNHLYTVNTI